MLKLLCKPNCANANIICTRAFEVVLLLLTLSRAAVHAPVTFALITAMGATPLQHSGCEQVEHLVGQPGQTSNYRSLDAHPHLAGVPSSHITNSGKQQNRQCSALQHSKGCRHCFLGHLVKPRL